MRVGGVTEAITLTLAPGPVASKPLESEATLLQRIAERPEETSGHLALAELYYREERFSEAAAVMTSAAALIAAEHAAKAGGRTTAVAPTGELDPPKKLRDVRPVYPAAARAVRASGHVIIEATIAEDGTVRDAEVRRSVPMFMFDDAALGAVRQWLYVPTRLNGVPVPVTMSAMITFAEE
jgi:protein TonB